MEAEFDDYIDPHRKELYFRVLNNTPHLTMAIAARLHFLQEHFPPHRLDTALGWLIRNELVGKVFLNWYQGQCGNSDLEMHRILIAVIDNAAIAPLYAGKNFKV